MSVTTVGRPLIPTDAAVAQRIGELFFSRTDVFAFQWWNRDKTIGGYGKACQHRPPWLAAQCPERKDDTPCSRCPSFAPIPLTEQVIVMHLRGQLTAGSYQLAQDGTSVKWACLDFDDHGQASVDELQNAVRLARMSLADLNLSSYPEASGGLGWRCHLWTFFRPMVPAIRAKVLLDAALRQCGLHEKPYIERFPKQSRALNGYGNLVKIPFGVHRKTGERSTFLTDDFEPIGNIATALESIKEVDPVVVDATIDLRHLSLQENALTDVASVKNFDLPSEIMNRILSHCAYFREVERRQIERRSLVHYEDWWNYLLMFARFGQAGVERILAFSQLDERYDRDYTLANIAYVRQHGYHAPSCRRLHTGPGQIVCPLDPLDCGAA